VVGVPGHPEGQDAVEQRVLVAVVARAGASLDAAAVKAAIAARLPGHQAPDHVVVADRLPRTSDGSGGPGKLLRRGIRDLYADQVR
jgi:acyl-CoA synthetase (AMP-forming)/AMP-acid ligase II